MLALIHRPVWEFLVAAVLGSLAVSQLQPVSRPRFGCQEQTRSRFYLLAEGQKQHAPPAELDRAFPAIPYHKLHYRVKILARSGRLRSWHVGRSVMLYVPE
jgi:hypothetical protein